MQWKLKVLDVTVIFVSKVKAKRTSGFVIPILDLLLIIFMANLASLKWIHCCYWRPIYSSLLVYALICRFNISHVWHVFGVDGENRNLIFFLKCFSVYVHYHGEGYITVFWFLSTQIRAQIFFVVVAYGMLCNGF
jgi:hypothetical protein